MKITNDFIFSRYAPLTIHKVLGKTNYLKRLERRTKLQYTSINSFLAGYQVTGLDFGNFRGLVGLTVFFFQFFILSFKLIHFLHFPFFFNTLSLLFRTLCDQFCFLCDYGSSFSGLILSAVFVILSRFDSHCRVRHFVSLPFFFVQGFVLLRVC